MKITLYGIPNCDTVKKSRSWFDMQGIDYVFHDFKKQGVPQEMLKQWIKALGWEALLNKKGATWHGLDAATQASVKDAASAAVLMQAQPSVIKRPVVQRGEMVTVGFTPEKWHF
jgi:Spx/MgsR family transcriptional regulator